jgi:hypothetical protein
MAYSDDQDVSLCQVSRLEHAGAMGLIAKLIFNVVLGEEASCGDIKKDVPASSSSYFATTGTTSAGLEISPFPRRLSRAATCHTARPRSSILDFNAGPHLPGHAEEASTIDTV